MADELNRNNEANEPEEDVNALEEGDIIEDLDAYRNAYLTAWFDSLTALEGEFNEKAKNVAVYIKNLTAEVNAIKAEEKRLKSRRVSAENQVERMKKYLLNSMQAIGVKKISMPRARITLRLNAESVVVENEKALIDWAMRHDETILKYQEPELKKTDIKELLRMGEKIPFARLERKESVMLK